MAELTLSQKKKRQKWLSKQVLELSKTASVKLFLAWEDLPYKEQQGIRNEWEKYYADVINIKAYRRFTKQKEAFLKKNPLLVKEYAQKAKEQRENGEWELKEPLNPDPNFIYLAPDTQVYRAMIAEMQKLKKDYELEDIEDIFT